MEKIKVIHDATGQTLTVWLGDPSAEHICEETPDEVVLMKNRAGKVIGFELLRGESSASLQLAAEIALSHHERWDGSGYPIGLSGEDIPLSGRIVALADAFDSLTSMRMFKPPWIIDRAVSAIEHESNRRFDPQVVRSFMAALSSLTSVKRQFDSELALAGGSGPS